MRRLPRLLSLSLCSRGWALSYLVALPCLLSSLACLSRVFQIARQRRVGHKPRPFRHPCALCAGLRGFHGPSLSHFQPNAQVLSLLGLQACQARLQIVEACAPGVTSALLHTAAATVAWPALRGLHVPAGTAAQPASVPTGETAATSGRASCCSRCRRQRRQRRRIKPDAWDACAEEWARFNTVAAVRVMPLVWVPGSTACTCTAPAP